MTKPATAKIFMSGRSQAVRLPKEFRLQGKEVRIRKDGHAIILEPLGTSVADVAAWFKAIDTARMSDDFMADGREQPEWPLERPNMFDDPDAYLASFADPKYDYPAPVPTTGLASARKRK